MITYIQGDLFTASKGVLAHACNTFGSWGAGVAVQFKSKFPEAYQQYHEHCKSNNWEDLVDTCYLIPSGEFTIACLFTNHDDSIKGIVRRTQACVADMVSQVDDSTPISMPEINAGIFGVPWEKTERVLNEFDREFFVYRLK